MVMLNFLSKDMTQLLQAAQQLDKAKGLTDEQVLENLRQVRAWRRRLAKLNAAMIKTNNNPPTAEEWKALEAAELAFKTPQK